MSDTDELELAKHLERLEEQNQDVSGDEDSDECGDGSGDEITKE